ncbi:MAG: mechanosensitive ion channel family protein [Gammaproteobacteria bacterium]|nr:mechanosensitive ion channel family protein [Gammaproteobacteria bacterium]
MSDLIAQWSDALAIDATLLQLVLVVLVGAIAHVALDVILRRLHKVAAYSAKVWDDIFVSAIENPVRCLLWVGVAQMALHVYELAPALEAALLRANDTLLILLLAWFLHRLISGVEQEMLCSSRGAATSVDKATVRAISKLARITMWTITALMVLQSLGVSVEGLLAFGGIGGIAVGFAAKDLLANFFGGISIYLDRPFTIGDWIRSPDKQIEGTVESIGWRLTVIRTFDQRPLYVPNAVFSQISVENPSRMFNRRIYETIGLRYEDASKVGTIVNEVRKMLQAHEAIDRDRTLIVNFVAFGPSSLDFFVYTFTRTTVWVEYHEIKQQILLSILEIIHRNGADVAFPTQTLHLNQPPAEPTE